MRSSDNTQWGPIGQQVFKRTYSLIKPDGQKETWGETVQRVVEGNLALVAPEFIEPKEKEKLMELLTSFGALPAGRHLNSSGVKGRQFLFNCLPGDTLVQTRQGLIPISELVGKQGTEVLSMGERAKSGIGCWSIPAIGVWRKASFQSYGKQKLYRVEFSDGSTIRATANHKWYVTKRVETVETRNLKGLDVPFVAPPKPERNTKYEQGVLHGFVFGDGTVSRNNGVTYSAYVQMFAEKDLNLVPLFEKHGYKVTYPDYCKAYVGRLPSEWKTLPPEDANNSYWLGFISGLLAADGTVSKSGSVFIYQSNKEILEIVSKHAQEVGFVTSPLYLQRANNPWTGEPAACWRLNLRRFSVNEEDLVLSHHRLNLIEAGDSKISSMRVIGVHDLNIEEEEVYCATEPETHTFVIGNNILTGNCHSSGFDKDAPEEHFSFTFDELMVGGGVGSNYSDRYINRIPVLKRSIDLHIVCRETHPNHSEFYHLLSQHQGSRPSLMFSAPDTREGWVEALDNILKTAWRTDIQDEELTVVIDVSKIRPRGSPLKTSGGIACGPGPLVSMLVDFTKHLNGCVGKRMSSLDVMTLDHIIAACVVAGGKRRSSRMSVKNWQDKDIFEFINCKREEGAHWTTNISVEIDEEFLSAYSKEDPHAKTVMRAVVLGTIANGEPGLWNRSLSQKGEKDPESVYCPNPCSEIILHEWEACNLGHVNLEFFVGRPFSEMDEAFRLMTRWLVRATFGDIPQRRQREVVDKNRRIGVGFFGFHAWLARNGVRYSDCHKEEWVWERLRKMAGRVQHEAYRYSQQLQIPLPVKNTAIAPTGTVAILPGTTTGAQAMMAPWFKRLVRYSSMDPEVEIRKREGYEVFPDEDAKNTEIVVYWCEDPLVAKVRASGFSVEEVLQGQYDIPLEDSLKVQSKLQECYADNAVSYTINLPNNNTLSEEYIEELLFSYLHRLKGTTLFIDKSRKNSPIQPMTKDQFDSYTGQKEVTMIEDVCKGGCPI